MRGWTFRCWWVVVLCGCAPTRAARIHELELPDAAARGNPVWSSSSVLVRRFRDARPPEYGRALPSSYIPPVMLFHSGSRSEYAEHAGGFWSKKVAHVGWLPVELPILLQRALPGENAVVADDLADGGAKHAWDFVVEGRLVASRMTDHRSFVMGLFALVGTPVDVYEYEFAYELTVFAEDQPIFRRRYAYDDRRSEGLWYHSGSSAWLKREALRRTLEASARDVVREVTLHRTRGPA